MANDTTLAFQHPEARAAAYPPSDMADRISLRDHLVEVEIGAFQPERGRTQRVLFNVVVEVRPSGVAETDDVDRVLSYDTITEAIAAALDEERLNLLETLAEKVAARVLAEPQALRCFVRIEKLDLGPGALGVEIVRAAGAATPDAGGEAPRPVIGFLTNPAIDSDGLSAMIDRVANLGPTILCVGPHPGAVPVTGHPLTQRRIDLLAIEQNCWRLAARDPRCVVVETRTELDWALKKGRISVWAPSKLVLDATHPPSVQALDTVALAAWLGEVMHAQRLVAVGWNAPEAPFPTERWEV
ncbi:D-erythro-7,8-dihydroneopterin triphosphate 2'-epimerase [Rhodobacteraceae bacterium THAF1]|uniref:dihydroneopterin aldolase n=1 Tax=Palleronia sp. THAF1 TaxID=2587842 RepID=UPI000F3B5002|nr:dihydroneopterin aldolase [Palleronia sp. THAF1]QFU07516.1 D-erythro-7,8-dihydroneopterin triphosphate 2'-epimerase [Palleronia sp. THAF1]VDC20479.1 D-erythro-7,8-dihydroneopterin triphosphate 2'-epimerase [Rhodobacteraceae bacterium THAF1]